MNIKNTNLYRNASIWLLSAANVFSLNAMGQERGDQASGNPQIPQDPLQGKSKIELTIGLPDSIKEESNSALNDGLLFDLQKDYVSVEKPKSVEVLTDRQKLVLANMRKELSGNNTSDRMNTANQDKNSEKSQDSARDSLLRMRLEFLQILNSGQTDNVRGLAEGLSFGNIKIVDVPVLTIEDLEQEVAFYNKVNDSITIKHFFLAEKAMEKGKFYNKELKSWLSREEMDHEIRLREYDAVIALAHELKHWLDRHLFLRLGFSAYQIAEIDIHEEISAYIVTLLYIRGVFLRTKNIEIAFMGMSYGKSKVFDYSRGMNSYELYLRKHLHVGQEPDSDEINALVQCAVEIMKACGEQYIKGIPKIVNSDCIFAINPFNYYKQTGKKKYLAPVADFNVALRRSYEIGRIDFLKECDHGTRAEISGLIEGFMKTPEFKKVLKNWKKGDAAQAEFAAYVAAMAQIEIAKRIASFVVGNQGEYQ
jgi:hypothetical protein